MKKFNWIFISFFILLLACESEPVSIPEEDGQDDIINKIMPLGASRVEGARPAFESFRYELWKNLIDNDWNIDYIGTQTDQANYPMHNGLSFDIDHEGRGGWTSGQILDGIETWLKEAGPPDIVLFSSPGGNDALQNLSYENAISNINAIIDIIQEANPNVTIVIEELAPGLSFLMTATLWDYFNRMQDDVKTIAESQTTDNSKVITVDMHSGFTDAMLADPVHYNEEGAKFIADKYYEVLSDILRK